MSAQGDEDVLLTMLPSSALEPGWSGTLLAGGERPPCEEGRAAVPNPAATGLPGGDGGAPAVEADGLAGLDLDELAAEWHAGARGRGAQGGHRARCLYAHRGCECCG